MKVPKDAPKWIFLQHDPEQTNEPFALAHEVSWCKDQIYETDIKYIRSDLVSVRIRQLTKGYEELRKINNRLLAKATGEA